MKVYIAKIDYFDPKTWPVLGAPYAGQNPKTSRANITEVADKLGKDGIALLVGAKTARTYRPHQGKLLGAVRCHMALYHTKEVVDTKHHTSRHFTRNGRGGGFRMPYAMPFSELWKCHSPLIQAKVACNDEINGRRFPPEWFIRLSDKQGKEALGVLEKHADGPFDLPRPDKGFICDL